LDIPHLLVEIAELGNHAAKDSSYGLDGQEITRESRELPERIRDEITDLSLERIERAADLLVGARNTGEIALYVGGELLDLGGTLLQTRSELLRIEKEANDDLV